MQARSTTALLIIAFILLASGCGSPIKRKVEKGIANSLPDIIGPARSYQVNVTGSDLRMIKGKLDTMQIVGQDVRLPNGITLAELTVFSRDIAFDTGKRVITRVDGTDFAAVLSETELNRYLRKLYPSVPELKVELQPGVLRIKARPNIAGFGPGVVADAALKVRDKRYIVLDFASIKVGPVGTPGIARDYAESKVNPVFDVSAIGYDATAKTVTVNKNGLALSGNLDLMALKSRK